MKKLFYLSLAALMVLAAVSCEKDSKNGKGVDGKTPLPAAVDLGLPSGTLWASFNLGASKEYEYGDYYAWGETITYYSSLEPLAWRERNGKSLGYDWPSYLYANGAYNRLTKYCPTDQTGFWDGAGIPDNNMELETGPAGDDVASKKLGGQWRMPTVEEIEELLSLKDEAMIPNSDYTWDSWIVAVDAQGKEVKDIWGNVVRGLRITRKSTGATLFLPASGFCEDTGVGYAVGEYGYFWSCAVDPYERRYAFRMYYNDDTSYYSSVDRYYGMPVRPVCVPASSTKAVDMGLSVKWGSCNLGASKPLDYGNFYSWGEMSTKKTYGDADDYTYSENPANLTTAGRDVAKKVLGGKWRMPTKAELEELIAPANCKVEKKTGDDGIYCVITSRKTGNSIMLPAASLKEEEGEPIDPGVFGVYWSSNPDPEKSGHDGAAYILDFEVDKETGKFVCCVSTGDRFYGMPIRPVCE